MNKSNKIDALDLQLYAVMHDIPDEDAAIYDALTPVEVPQKTWNRIERKLKRRIRYAEQHTEYSPVYEVFKNLVATVLLIMSLGFACMMSIRGVREAIRETITTWYENSIFVQCVCDEEEEQGQVPETILEFKEPVIENGYSVYEKNKTDYMYVISYINDKKEFFYQQGVLGYYDTWLSNHDTDMRDITVRDCSGKLTESYVKGALYRTIIWHDSSYAYMIAGSMEISDLIAIAETVK